MLHATDVWVAQVGVPISLRNWEGHGADSAAGLHRAAQAIPLADIRPYVVDVSNNGELSRTGSYWTSEDDVRRLFSEVIPNATKSWKKKRVLLYLHGGLNDEDAVARRVVAYRDVLLANQIYPLHIMWESGVFQTLGGIVQDVFTDVDERAGAVADWMQRLRDGLGEAKDRSLELTLSPLGTAMWREMKENARLASKHPDGIGAMALIARHALAALAAHPPAERARWEIHVVGHSAGSIFAAHALEHLIKLESALKSIQFLAPAITIADYKALVVPRVEERSCPLPTIYNLSDAAERADTVGPYAKSLLYLVSNAFEGQRGTPLLGMTRYLVADEQGCRDDVDAPLARMHAKKVDNRPSLVITGGKASTGSFSQSTTHGGFDADVATMNSVLQRILGSAPAQAFTERDLSFKSKASSFAPQHPVPLQQVDLPAQRRAPANNQVRNRRLG
jgi:pimeloyl-ACP methyl ester carboxylesterase